MSTTQRYIGSPNGVVGCWDGRDDRGIRGRLYHHYTVEACGFTNLEELVHGMEALFDRMGYPQPTHTRRTFIKEPSVPRKKGMVSVMTDEEMLNQHGDLGTFVIRVQHRQNSSWQGRLTWLEEDKTVNFRSVWEMVRLVENALGSEGIELPNWFPEEEKQD